MRGTQSGWLLVVVFCLGGAAGGQAERIIYVDEAAVGADDGSSWPDAYMYLQDALAEAAGAVPPVEIRVAQGVYKPDQGAGITPGDLDATFQLLNGVMVKGGYAGTADPNARAVEAYTTILSGDLNGDDKEGSWDRPDNSLQIVVCGATAAAAVIDGFTIVGASRTGIAIENSSATIRDCTFENNKWHGLQSIQSNALVLVNCRFIENGRCGISGWDCRAVLTNCVLERNATRDNPPPYAAIRCPSGHGPGSDTRSSHLILTDCILRENEEGGLDVAGTVDLTRCSFTGNDGEAVHCSGTLTASRCTFVANKGSRAGAIRCREDFMLGDVEFDCTLLDCEFIGNKAFGPRGGGAVCAEGDTLTATQCVFAGNTGGQRAAGAMDCSAKVMRLSRCTFAGNTSCPDMWLRAGVGAVSSSALDTQISNCTFTGNRGEPSAFEHHGVSHAGAALTQCIVWNGEQFFAGEVSVTYSDVQGGIAGEGNLDVDPCFVDPGYWDASGTPDDPEDDVWVAGDYHLKSQAGHWDVESGRWVLDDATSLCIDAGDPNAAIDAEPFPNGGFVNMGAYGGTAEASRSYFGGPLCTTQIAGDINGDCRIDDLDLDILLSHWMMEDIGRINMPPTITIVSPQDGAEFSYPEPIVLQFETADPDGRVVYINYRLEHDHDGGHYTTGSGTDDPPQGWVREHGWSHIRYDGLYVLRVKAFDNEGAKTVSPEVRVTLRP
jgi:hypothetical protein